MRDAKIDSIYEGNHRHPGGISSFEDIRDQGLTVANLVAEMSDFVKSGDGGRPPGEGGPGPDDRRPAGHLERRRPPIGLPGEPTQIYKAGLHLTPLLESMAEASSPGKFSGTPNRWSRVPEMTISCEARSCRPGSFVRHVAPKVGARRAAAEVEDGELMELADAAF